MNSLLLLQGQEDLVVRGEYGSITGLVSTLKSNAPWFRCWSLPFLRLLVIDNNWPRVVIKVIMQSGFNYLFIITRFKCSKWIVWLNWVTNLTSPPLLPVGRQ